MDSDSTEPSDYEDEDDAPLKKRDIFADKFKEKTTGLCYLKFAFNGKNLRKFVYNGKLLHNILDVYDMRKKLYKLRDIDNADFDNLYGQHIHEYNYGNDDDLWFESNYESGNLCLAIKDPDGVYNLEMMADTNSPGHTQWFYFTVSNAKMGQTVKFRILNFKKLNSQYNADNGMKVCYYSKKRFKKKEIEWTRGGKGFAYVPNDGYIQNLGLDEKTVKRNVKKNSLEFQYTFEHNKDEVSFAFCFPYTYDDLLHDSHKWMVRMRKIKHIVFKKKLLCYTLSGRKVFYFVSYKQRGKKKLMQLKDQKVVVFSARVHPGESNSSYVLKGLMAEFCKIDSPAAEYLRENYIVIIIPMLNPDGVSIGNSRTSLSGYDLNRCWKNPDRYIHPEIYYSKKLISNVGKNNKIVFFTDFHGHEAKDGCFMYGCNVTGSSKATREFPAMLYELCNHFEK